MYDIIFIDTNLKTHLVIPFHDNDTVSIFKEKIIEEHLHCFPHFGDITINAIKVKRRGCFYHLSQSLSLISVFGFKSKARFLYVDASTSTSVKELDDPRVENRIDAITNDDSVCANRDKLLLLSSNEDVVGDTHPLKRKREELGAGVVAEQLSLDGVVGCDVLKNVEFSGRDGEVKSLNAERDPLVQEKDDIYDKEIEMERTPVASKISDPENKIHDYLLDNVTSVPIFESVPPTKKKKKSSKKRKQSVPDLSLKEKGLRQEIVSSVVSPDDVVENRNSIGGSDNVSRETGLTSTDGTAVLRKHVELKTDKSSDVKGHCDKSAEDKTPQEPVAKRRRKDGKYGSKELSKTDEAVVLESNKKTVNPLPVSQHSQEDQQNLKNPTLNGGIPDDVNMHLTHQTSGKKKKTKTTKNTLDQGITVLPTSGKDVQGKSSVLVVNSKNFSEKPDALLLKEKQRYSVPETNERPSLGEIDMGDLDASDVGARHEDCKTAVKVNSKSSKYSEDQPLVDNIKGVEEGQNLSLKFSLETVPSEKSKPPGLDELASRDKEVVISPKLVEARATVDPLKSSKKRKKSKKSKELVKGTPSASVSEHVEVNGTSLCKYHKAIDANHRDDNDNEEPNMLPKEGKTASEVETSKSSMAPEKEIDDMIENAIEWAGKIRPSEVTADSRDGKSRKKSKKKQTPDCVESNNVGEELDNNILAPLANTITKEAEHSSGSSLLGQSSQGQQGKMKSHNEGRCLEAVGNGNFSNNGHANEGDDDLEVSQDSTGINFNNYFVPGELKQKSVSSGVALASGITKEKDANSGVKAKKNKKKLDFHGTSSNVPSSHSLTESQGLGAKSLKISDSGLKTLPSSRSDKLNSVSGKASDTNAVNSSGISSRIERKVVAANSRLESSKDTNLVNKRVNACHPEENNFGNSKKTPTINGRVVVNNLQHKKSIIGAADSIFNDALDGVDEESSTEDASSDDNTRTPSDKSLSSDYSDGNSQADPNLMQNESQSWRGRKTIRKPLNTSGMSLDEILRSSSRYKKAKLTASQLELEEFEMQPVEFVPESQNP